MRQLLPKMLVFVVVVEEGSFTAAARVLGKTKSVVSQHISQLERELEVTLLQRSTRHLALTHIGKQFFQRCKEIEQLTKSTLEGIQDFTSQPKGPLCVTCPFALAEPLVIPAFVELSKLYPKLQPRFICTDDRLDLHTERIDVAISVGKLKESNYRVIRIGRLQNILCTSPSYLSSLSERQTIDDLPALRGVTAFWQGTESTWTFVKGDVEKELRLCANATCNTLLHVVSFLKSGMGVGILPLSLILSDLSDGSLLPLFPDYSIPERNIYAVHPYQQQTPLHVRRFIEIIRKRCLILNGIST